MSTRLIRRVPGLMEDLAIGLGKMAQTRNGETVEGHQLAINTLVAAKDLLKLEGPQIELPQLVAYLDTGKTIDGGVYFWSSTADKSKHDGISVLAPEALSSWDGQANTYPSMVSWTGTGPGVWVQAGDAVLRQDLANPDKGAAMVGRGVVAVDSIADLAALAPGQRSADKNFNVAGFYVGSNIGGGVFKWAPSKDRSAHDGVTVIDPARALAWDGTSTDLITLFSPSVGPGTGCFVRVSTEVFVDAFGAVHAASISGPDSTLSFAHMQKVMGFISLSPFSEYHVSSLPRTQLKIQGEQSVIHHSRLLAYSQYNMLDISSVIFDGNNSDFFCTLKVLSNSRVKLRGVVGRNVSSQTYLRMFDISTENVSIDIDGAHSSNLSAAENGIIGDVNGSCRFIYIGDEMGVTVTSPSRGKIQNISGVDLMPKEDGDMIHVQSGSPLIFPIEISNIYGRNVAKRLVKIQCSGPNVSNVFADATDNADSMHAIVSHLGSSGSVHDVQGVGKLTYGVATQSGGVKVRRVRAITSVTKTDSAVCSSNTSCDFHDLYGEGFEYISKNYCTEPGAVIRVSKIRGEPLVSAVRVRPDAVLDKIEIKDVDCEVQGASGLDLVLIRRGGSSTGKVGIVSIDGVHGETPYYNAVRVGSTDKTIVAGVDAESSLLSVEIAGGEVEAVDIDARGLKQAVRLLGTTKALIIRPRGATEQNVRLENACTNTVVLNSIADPGILPVYDVHSDSTGTQVIEPIVFA